MLKTGVTLYYIRHGETDWNRAQRYQHIGDLLIDLQSLKRRLAFETELERSGGRTIEAAPSPSGTGSRTRLVVVGLSALLLAVSLGYWALASLSPEAAVIDSIAVLPFENVVHDQRLDYLERFRTPGNERGH